MKWFKNFIAESNTSIFQKVGAEFKTTDGLKHFTGIYNWFNSSSIRCSVGEHLMIDICSCGYITDVEDVMYPLTNIVSIEWVVYDEKVLDYPNDKLSDFNKVFTDDEFEALGAKYTAIQK